MAVNPVEEGPKLNEFMADFDELEIEKIFLTRHDSTFALERLRVNGEDEPIRSH